MARRRGRGVDGSPLRRCAGCRRVAGKSELVRLALAHAEASPAGRVVLDPRGSLGGRGAYLCKGPCGSLPDAGCLRTALERGGVARALRTRAPLDPELVESVDRGEEARS